MYGFDLWIKIAHLLFYLYSSGQFWQLKFSFIDQCSHCAHEGTGAHSLLHSRNDDFWFHDRVRLGIITDVTISSKSQCPRQEVCCKTQSPFKEGRRKILGGSLQAQFNAVRLGLGYLCPFEQWTWEQWSMGRGWFSKDWRPQPKG